MGCRFLPSVTGRLSDLAAIGARIGTIAATKGWREDVPRVARGMAHDHRMGREFLDGGLDIGGSCLLKDMAAPPADRPGPA